MSTAERDELLPKSQNEVKWYRTSMVQALPYIQIVLSVLLVAGILLQRSEASLGSAFGSDSAGGTRFTRRGFEKTLFNGTILIAVLFVLSAFASLLLPR